ncbi:hypothetical protein ACL02S_21770 [Nocardia sp. 004]
MKEPAHCEIDSFWSLSQVRVVISDWKTDDNHHCGYPALSR